MMRVKDLGEDALIKGLAERFPASHPRLVKGIGDDTSVSRQKNGKYLLATTDLLIEGTHFLASHTTGRMLGRKALSISLSDIAAMGGRPLLYLVSIALPPMTPKAFVDDLYEGLHERAIEHKVGLAGGNTARDDKIMISTTVLGEADPKNVIFRSGAKAGDIIYVTGGLGDSALGLEVLMKDGLKKAIKGRYSRAVKKHLDPLPRVEAGMMLAKSGLISAMMDISDGIGLDLERLCHQSKTNADIELSAVPISDELKSFAKGSDETIIRLAIAGGEDYELLFTSSEKNGARIKALGKRLSLPIQPIGRVTAGGRKHGKVTVRDSSGRVLDIKKTGFKHF